MSDVTVQLYRLSDELYTDINYPTALARFTAWCVEAARYQTILQDYQAALLEILNEASSHPERRETLLQEGVEILENLTATKPPSQERLKRLIIRVAQTSPDIDSAFKVLLNTQTHHLDTQE
jgi:hypothetical protein